MTQGLGDHGFQAGFSALLRAQQQLRQVIVEGGSCSHA